jgi:hypothetical protein
MVEQSYSLHDVTQRIMAECRRDIRAAAIQIEAGKEIVRRSRRLLPRWEAQGRTSAIRLPPFDAGKAGMFVLVQSDDSRRRRSRGGGAVVRRGAPSDPHSHRRSASG